MDRVYDLLLLGSQNTCTRTSVSKISVNTKMLIQNMEVLQHKPNKTSNDKAKFNVLVYVS